MKKVKNPLTEKAGKESIVWKQRDFSQGLFLDLPASEIPDGSLAKADNVDVFHKHFQGRFGSDRWSGTVLPPLSGRTGITASRTDSIVTRTSGPLFDYDDVGNYFVWPNNIHNEIIAFINTNQVQTRQSGPTASVGGCYLRGSVYGCFYHKNMKRIIIHIDTRIFVADVSIISWNEAYGISYHTPLKNKSVFAAMDNYAIMFNSYGIFKVNMEDGVPYYYKINAIPPQTLILGVLETDALTYGYRYTYSMSRLIGGTYFNDRRGETITIEQGSGSCVADEESKDYGDTFIDLPLGLGTEVHGVLTGGNGVTNNIATWAAINDGTAQFTLNAETYNIQVDFTGVSSLEMVASRIQTILRRYWASATCEIEEVAGPLYRFAVSPGEVDGATVDFTIAGVGGTDISGAGLLELTVATGAVIDNAIPFTTNSVIGRLVVATVKDTTPDTQEYHNTHFTIWRSREIKSFSPEILIWSKDVPIAKAFTSERAGQRVEASEGRFDLDDIGSWLEWENGIRDQIERLGGYGECLPYGAGDYMGEGYNVAVTVGAGGIAEQSTALGDGEILTLSQDGYTVTRNSGTKTFSVDDLRKPIFWADGTISYITSFIDANNVGVFPFYDKVLMAATMDPTGRYYNDMIDDDTMEARIKRDSIKQRGYRELPDCNVGTTVPGFLAGALKGDNVIYYSALGFKYLAGYQDASIQYDDKPKDGIQSLKEFPDFLVVYCNNSTWGVPTNFIDPSLTVGTLPNVSIIDNIGVNAELSIVEVDIGNEFVLTSEPAIRLFNGAKFSNENIAENKVMKIVDNLKTNCIGAYSRDRGLILWGTQEGD